MDPKFPRTVHCMDEGYDTVAAVRYLVQADPDLHRLVHSVGPCTLKPPTDTGPHTLFDRLASSILSQQLSVKAAATITGRLRDRAAGPDDPAGSDNQDGSDVTDNTNDDEKPGAGRRHLVPTRVAALDDDELRACGISRPKVAALRDLANAVTTARIPTLPELVHLSDEQVISALTSVRGIGRWTVEMQLIFLLGRPDVFPVADVGVRRGFERTLRLEHKATPAEMLEKSAAWAPYRSVASWYLWRAADQTGEPAPNADSAP